MKVTAADQEVETREENKKRQKREILTIVGAVIAYGLYRIAFLVPGIVENIYSRGVFKFLNQILSTVTGWLPFSLAEFMVYGLVIFCIFFVIQTVASLVVCSQNRLYYLLRRLLLLFAIAAHLVTSFIFSWGLNYAREPLAKTMDLEVAPASKEELYQVCQALVKRANALRLELAQDESGAFTSKYSRQQILNRVPEIYETVSQNKRMVYFAGSFGPPKGILNSVGMSYAGLVGVYFPFTGEANVNADIPMLTFISGAFHEAAHQRGFAREDEANFIAYYMCQESGDKDFEYSGVMTALIYASNALYDTDTELFGKILNQYSDAVRRDFAEYNVYWDKFGGPVNKAIEKINDNYLKMNMQQDGVQSYGRMVDLLIAQYKKDHTI